MYLNKRVYDVLKFIAMILLPAAGTAYFGLAEIWHLPYADEVVGTVVVVDTFMGVVLGISTRQYNKAANVIDGDLVVSEADGETFMALGINGNVDRVTGKDEVRLRVVQNPVDKPE